MYCSSFQASKKAQPPLPSWFSASLNSVQRTSKIYGSLGEGSEAETEPHFREWRRNLTGWLASSSFTFITFVIPLANLLACGDNPKSLTQLAKNEVYRQLHHKLAQRHQQMSQCASTWQALNVVDIRESSPLEDFSIAPTNLRFCLLFHLELRCPSRSLESTAPGVGSWP